MSVTNWEKCIFLSFCFGWLFKTFDLWTLPASKSFGISLDPSSGSNGLGIRLTKHFPGLLMFRLQWLSFFSSSSWTISYCCLGTSVLPTSKKEAKLPLSRSWIAGRSGAARYFTGKDLTQLMYCRPQIVVDRSCKEGGVLSQAADQVVTGLSHQLYFIALWSVQNEPVDKRYTRVLPLAYIFSQLLSRRRGLLFSRHSLEKRFFRT